MTKVLRVYGQATRVVVLSPHADDAAWSLGGLLHLLGARAHVITIYDGDPPVARPGPSNAAVDAAEATHAWRGLRSAALRRMEDARAATLLGISIRGLGEPDAALRRDPCGNFEHAAFETLFPSYQQLKALRTPAWFGRLVSLIEPDDIVLAPMAFGRHVDHYLTLLAARSFVPEQLLLYAEFPYWERNAASAATEVQAHLATLGLNNLSMSEVPVHWNAWRTAASAYRSQVLRLFGSHTAFVERLERFADRQGAQASCAIWSSRSL